MTSITLQQRLDELRRNQAELARREDEEFMASVGVALTAGLKLKQVMKQRGLRRARADCPRCSRPGALQGALVGRRDHLRMWCETPACEMGMME